ncbi:MAG: DUF1573 domain-containing protein [Candidatus Omnitrophica bacterium]|nr:DUF1573 domain-containing protein [Candidatus Omnitrophota bacterium]
MSKKLKVIVFVLLVAFFSSTVFAGAKEDIYSKLECCKCGKSFISCTCAHAKEMKAYIDAFLEAGLGEEEIMLKIAKKYSLDSIIDFKTKKVVEKKLIEEAGAKRPEIFIKPLAYDLGKVSKSKGKLELAVKVKNKGNTALTINELKTSCGCTTVRLKTKKSESPAFSMNMENLKSSWKADLAPAEEGKLIIVTDLDHPHVKLGHMARSVTIKSNDPVYSTINVEFEVEIVE